MSSLKIYFHKSEVIIIDGGNVVALEYATIVISRQVVRSGLGDGPFISLLECGGRTFAPPQAPLNFNDDNTWQPSSIDHRGAVNPSPVVVSYREMEESHT
jgi:hypothetical protein